MFKKDKSFALKTLNLVLLFAISCLVVSLINAIFDAIYPGAFMADMPNVDWDYVYHAGHIQPIFEILILLVVHVIALFVINKVKVFNKKKPVGLEIVTCVSTLMVVFLLGVIASGIIMDPLSITNSDNLAFIAVSIIIALMPVVARLLNIFPKGQNAWLGVIGAGLMITVTSIVCAIVAELTVQFLFRNSDAVARFMYTSIILFIISSVALYVVKNISEKSSK